MGRFMSLRITSPAAQRGRPSKGKSSAKGRLPGCARWDGDVEQARRIVATEIMNSIETKWGTAAAVERSTGLSRSEISRIKNGNFKRFSLDRLVCLLKIVDEDVEVALRVTPIRKSRNTLGRGR
jgi:predicted XRE-type DNA-binding protein